MKTPTEPQRVKLDDKTLAAYADKIVADLPAPPSPAYLLPGLALACVLLLWSSANFNIAIMHQTMKAMHEALVVFHTQVLKGGGITTQGAREGATKSRKEGAAAAGKR